MFLFTIDKEKQKKNSSEKLTCVASDKFQNGSFSVKLVDEFSWWISAGCCRFRVVVGSGRSCSNHLDLIGPIIACFLLSSAMHRI